jgi:hypothetical protein
MSHSFMSVLLVGVIVTCLVSSHIGYELGLVSYYVSVLFEACVMFV